jgi:crotonobetainyl-CoA:carnitine CoA-transferase CaiB-like acyl-CoA transferase
MTDASPTNPAGTRGGSLLSGLRIVEVSMLGPGLISTPLADLGADIIKVEPPAGDYIRKMSWPIIEGTSHLHLHISRGKRSIVLDLSSEQGRAVFLDLVKTADAVVEAMRPGGLARRGLGYEQLQAVNPKIVMVTVSGYGMTGPYRDLASHGIAYDAWGGTVAPVPGPGGFPTIPDHTSIGIAAGPLYGTAALLAAVLAARETGSGCHLEVAQSDAAAAFDWMRIEGERAYLRPQSEVTGNASDNYERRPVGTGGMADAVRYQFYESADGHVLFMASEQKFWKNFCSAIGRDDLYEANPGERLADHARGNLALRGELAGIFMTRTTAEWVQLGLDADVPLGPVNTPATIVDDPQYADRLPFAPASRLGTDLQPFPVRVVGEAPPVAANRAPEVGQHTDEVLSQVLGYDAARIAELHAGGALGQAKPQ